MNKIYSRNQFLPDLDESRCHGDSRLDGKGLPGNYRFESHCIPRTLSKKVIEERYAGRIHPFLALLRNMYIESLHNLPIIQTLCSSAVYSSTTNHTFGSVPPHACNCPCTI